MAWTMQRAASPKVFYARSPARPSWSSGRVLSWCVCVLIFVAIVFWPQKPVSSPGQKRPAVSRRPLVDGDAPHVPRKKPKKQQRIPAQAEEHVYSTDGLLHVNPRAKHPILELIERSETNWRRKLEHQSKTFKQAVDEYKLRYNRAPPKGFEIWWDYVTFHDVKLVDEYDSIHAHIHRFWGISPSVLRETQAAAESYSHTFTIGKLPGASTVDLLNSTVPHDDPSAAERLQDQLDIIEDIQEYLPEFRATFTMHDGPQHMASWELRRQAEQAADRGEYIDTHRVAAEVKTRGWIAACPPNSPIQSYVPPPLPTSPIDLSSPHSPASPKSKTFIYNHLLSMSPCLHPAHIVLNGFLSQYHYHYQFGPNPEPILTPTFSICVSPLHSDILAVAPEQYTDDVGVDPAWADKVDERLLWRGSNTGIRYVSGNWWNASQRVRLVELGTRRGGETRVLLPRGPSSSGSGSGSGGAGAGDQPDDKWDRGAVGYGDSVRTSALNAAFMDVAFVGDPIQCRELVCEELKRMFEWRPYQLWQDAWIHKYIMDIDGNGWSARFKRLMTSNSLVFKSTLFPEWYAERIMPWVHYIPVQVDLSDIYDILAFFRGDLSGAGAHDELAERIATAGKTWSQDFFRREDMTAYHFRLFLEYGRVMSLDREAMTYKDGDENRDSVPF